MAEYAWQIVGHDVSVSRLSPPTIQMLRLRGFDDDVLDALDRSLLLGLPREASYAVGTVPRAIGLAPGEWMIVGGTITDNALVTVAADAAVAHVADIGEGRVVYAVVGRRARDLIAKGCTIDLHPRAFGAGRCAQSALAQVFVIIDQPSDDAVFHIYAEASYAQHLELWFADAILEFRSDDPD